ncbi:hypothetical protein [Bacillus sp. AFS017336]|uniref:hypothetical protein n=1 Tax=Bacillus sp. AFS017336 TaxID=2033489 RepID=UPI000BF00D7F|nr:hypothetical protein [Bacillus sp. AFS017336]PEL14477.1 hypothetical protein CN601_00205 [Bacillus sp. AFS017336]
MNKKPILTNPLLKLVFYFDYRMDGGFTLLSIKKVASKLVILAIVLTLISIEIKVVKASIKRIDNKELTLKEAIYLGLNRAKTWNKNASLTRITSVDENLEGSKGETGKRYYWNMEFSASNQKLLSIGISQGKISFSREHVGDNNGTIKLEDIKFDSPYLLNIAKKKYGLQKGLDWATGYQYTLDLIEGKPSITILGTDRNKLFTRISFDPKNAEVTGAIHKVPYGGGLISLQKESKSSKITQKSMAIMGITAGKRNLVTWGDRKPTQFNTANHPFLRVSSNIGEKLTDLEISKYVKYAWFNPEEELYVSTASEIWSNVTSKNKGNKILNLKKEIENIDYSLNNNIAVLSDGMVYTTITQGDSWGKHTVPESLRTIQISDKGELFILTQNREIHRKNKDKWNAISIPKNVGIPWDMKILKNKIVITTDIGLWIRDVSGSKWKKLQTDEQIFKLIKKGQKLFGITDRGAAIYEFDFGNETIEKIEKVYEAKDNIVLDIDVFQNILFIATIPNYVWEEM